ncbi:MAG: hypothetical protein RI958_633 [Actinomycetota bacterium]
MSFLSFPRRSTRHRLMAAVIAVGALTVASCSTDLETSAGGTGVAAPDDTASREAAGSEVGWTVPAAKGGNGNPDTPADINDCIPRFTRTSINDYILCMFIDNDTRRLTATPNVYEAFPLTVSRFLNNRNNAELGGEKAASHYGRLAGQLPKGLGVTFDCGSQCVGRLSPNPFTKSGMMTFVGLDGGVFEISGITTRLFVTSGEAPMSTNHQGAQPYYDMPAWSGTNYGWCTQGEYFACDVVSIPSGGSKTTARYRVSTRPLDVFISANLPSNTTLVRVGQPTPTGLLLDARAESKNAVSLKGGETARYGGYRAADGRNTVLTITYEVADANGNTDQTICEQANPAVIGCGSSIVVSVVLDKDGNATASKCTTNNTQPARRTFKCDQPIVSGDAKAPMIVTIGIRN